MGYMTSYKRLDNLCRDMYNGENGVTAYIEEMERYSYAASSILGWKSTYDALKHYRYIRNQIAHEEYASEENMTSQADTDWLDNFYQQIMQPGSPEEKVKAIEDAMRHFQMIEEKMDDNRRN